VGRTFVGRRGVIAGVGGLSQLGLGAGQAIGEFRHLPRELHDHPVLLLDVPLQESETFLEGALAFIHAGKMKGEGARARLGIAEMVPNTDGPSETREQSWKV
jgi:hypothetical protein